MVEVMRKAKGQLAVQMVMALVMREACETSGSTVACKSLDIMWSASQQKSSCLVKYALFSMQQVATYRSGLYSH